MVLYSLKPQTLQRAVRPETVRKMPAVNTSEVSVRQRMYKTRFYSQILQ
jgi:hypothetical protein